MTKTSDWIYCRLVDRGNFIFPRRPFWLGQVEFSDSGMDEGLSAVALTNSMSSFAVSETGEGWAQLVRARLPILRVDATEAKVSGAFHLLETIQAFNAHLAIGMSKLRATDAGYLYDIRERTVVPLQPPWRGREFKGISAMLDLAAQHPLHVLNTLHAAPQAYGELGDAFRRSSHWRELAENAEDEGEALLLYWMAAECLCKQSHDEEIRSKLLAAFGLPTARIAKSIDLGLTRQLALLPGHRPWRKRLAALFDGLRIARNKIVHAGYRNVDLPALLGEDNRRLGMFVLPLVTKCLLGMALQAMNHRQTSLGEMWQRYETALQPSGLLRHAEWVIGRLENGEQPAPRARGASKG